MASAPWCLPHLDITSITGRVRLLSPKMNHMGGLDSVIPDVVTGDSDIEVFTAHDQASKTFTLFPKLPAWIRCRIWRMTWTRRLHIHMYSGQLSIDEPDLDFSALPKTGLPVSAYVNRESRSCTLQRYHKIPDSRYVTFKTSINFKLDVLYIDHFLNRASVYPDVLFKKIERLVVVMHLMIQRYRPEFQQPIPSEVPECWLKGCCFPETDHRTFNNFIHYIFKRYFPKVKKIYFMLMEGMSDEHTPYPLRLHQINPDIVPSIRTFFIRTPDGRGLEFSSSFERRTTLREIKIRVVGEREAAKRKDDENPTDHQTFLDYLGVCFWNVFSPEWLLKGDEEVEQLIRQHQHHHS
ncbi:P-loop containing nucleoside triphosphate hydrolase protein [Apiospora arundinis]